MMNQPPIRTKKLTNGGQVHPWTPAQYRKSDAYAFKALQRGDATAEQQKAVLYWLIHNCADTYNMSFRPGGVEGQRETDFAEGKRFVGNQIVKLVNIDVSLLKEEN